MKTINYTPKKIDSESIKTREYNSNYYVYCLRCNDTNEIVYIGKTNRILDTYNRHCTKIVMYDLSLEIIAECYCNEVAVFIEDRFLNELDRKSLYLNKLIPKI